MEKQTKQNLIAVAGVIAGVYAALFFSKLLFFQVGKQEVAPKNVEQARFLISYVWQTKNGMGYDYVTQRRTSTPPIYPHIESAHNYIIERLRKESDTYDVKAVILSADRIE